MSEYETTTETASEENAFPDLTAIGRAFAGAITYINTQDYTDLQTEARSWLEMLRINKDSPTRLPGYAFDPNFETIFFSENVPFKLLPFAGQLVSYMAQLLEACGLDAKVSFNHVALYNPPIRIGIKFPQAVKGAEKSTGGEIIVSDGDFQKEFFRLMGSLRIEG